MGGDIEPLTNPAPNAGEGADPFTAAAITASSMIGITVASDLGYEIATIEISQDLPLEDQASVLLGAILASAQAGSTITKPLSAGVASDAISAYINASNGNIGGAIADASSAVGGALETPAVRQCLMEICEKSGGKIALHFLPGVGIVCAAAGGGVEVYGYLEEGKYAEALLASTATLLEVGIGGGTPAGALLRDGVALVSEAAGYPIEFSAFGGSAKAIAGVIHSVSTEPVAAPVAPLPFTLDQAAKVAIDAGVLPSEFTAAALAHNVQPEQLHMALLAAGIPQGQFDVMAQGDGPLRLPPPPMLAVKPPTFGACSR
jgi:hypothetical protein